MSKTMIEDQPLEVSDFGYIPDDASPLYFRIAARMGEYIRSNQLAAGTRLPSERQLAQYFGVSIITIRAALKGLVDDGVIERQQGTGTFVRRSDAAPTQWALGSVEGLIHASQHSEVSIIRHGFVATPKWAASYLETASGQRTFNIQVVRSQRDKPFLLTDAYYPQDVGERLATIDIARHLKSNHFVIGVVEQITRTKVSEIRQTIAAASASEQVGRLLGVRTRSPILLITRLSYASNGRLLQVARSHYQTNDFSYSLHLKRD